jgi:hypothetical protein
MNRLSTTDRARVLACLVEGNSIRATGPYYVRACKSAIVFSESDCGGVFDGNVVTSDADPGL